jgi:hypothetical protein
MTSNDLFQSEDNIYNNRNNNQLNQVENGVRQILGNEQITTNNNGSEPKKSNLKKRFLKLVDISLTSFFFTTFVVVFWVIIFV